MAPAGRPRSPATRSLAPGVYARTRSGRTRYYDAQGKALGSDPRKAALIVAQRYAPPEITRSTWVGASKEYRAKLAKATLSAHTVKAYLKYLETLEAVIGMRRLDDLRPLHVHQIMHALEDRPAWARQILMMFRQVWQRAISVGLTEKVDPSATVKMPSVEPRKVRVTDAMLLAVAEHGNQAVRDWCRLSVVCGQRVSDVLILTRAHIVGDELRPPNTKTGEPVRIAIEGDLKTVLDELISRPRKVSGLHLIQNAQGRQVTYSALSQAFDKAAKRAREADPALPHFQRRDLRAKSATDTPDTAQARLGHASAKMTERHYLRGDAPLAKPGRLPKEASK